MGGLRGPTARAVRRLVAGLLALLLAGCTWSTEEPGLFPERTGGPEPQPTSQEPIRPTNPELPVVGERIWTTGEGLRVTVRYAVHAVRRIAGATVLDWSVTPLAAPKLAAGSTLPSWVDLGLTRQGKGDVAVLLLDPARGRVYRPLNHRSARQFNHCLCTPTWVAQLNLRIGDTRLLQTTYPELPAGLGTVGVSMANLPVFPAVPVTPAGQAPLARVPTDLQRPAEESAPVGGAPYTITRATRDGRQRVLSLTVETIELGPGYTSVEWTVRSLADQPRFTFDPAGPPLTAELPDGALVVDTEVASGPVLRAGPRRLSASWMTATVQSKGFYECLCSTLGLWARSLRQAGGSATLTTLYPVLPAGTRTVDVVLPGATTLWRLPVRSARGPTGPTAGVPVVRRVSTWRYDNQNPPPGWSTAAWPTPVPDPAQLADYEAFVETIEQLPRG